MTRGPRRQVSPAHLIRKARGGTRAHGGVVHEDVGSNAVASGILQALQRPARQARPAQEADHNGVGVAVALPSRHAGEELLRRPQSLQSAVRLGHLSHHSFTGPTGTLMNSELRDLNSI